MSLPVQSEVGPQEGSRKRAAEPAMVTFHLLGIVRSVTRGKRLLLIASALGLVLGLALAFVLPPWYEAEAVFLPPERPEQVSPTSIFMGQQDTTDTYLGMLSSRSVADYVIDHAGLMKTFKSKLRTDARTRLAQVSKFTVSKNQLITVNVKLGDPQLASEVANDYLEALYRLNGSMVASASSHRREFLEAQLEEQKNSLAQAEQDLKTTQERTGVVLPEGEAQAGLNAIVQLQGQINLAETRLAGLRVAGTEENPEVIQAKTQLAELRAQLGRLQAKESTGRAGRGLPAAGELPGMALEYTRRLRELKLRESIYQSLTQQYEKARIATLDPGPQLQIVDQSVVPERKAGPPRKLLALGGTLLGFLTGLGYLLLGEPLRRLYSGIAKPGADTGAI